MLYYAVLCVECMWAGFWATLYVLTWPIAKLNNYSHKTLKWWENYIEAAPVGKKLKQYYKKQE